MKLLWNDYDICRLSEHAFREDYLVSEFLKSEIVRENLLIYMREMSLHSNLFRYDSKRQFISQATGIGKLKPNIVLLGYKADWKVCDKKELNQYFNVMHKVRKLSFKFVNFTIISSSLTRFRLFLRL